MWNEMSWDRMPGTGTEVPTIGEFLAGNPVPHLVPHDMSVTLGVPARAREPRGRDPTHDPGEGNSPEVGLIIFHSPLLAVTFTTQQINS